MQQVVAGKPVDFRLFPVVPQAVCVVGVRHAIGGARNDQQAVVVDRRWARERGHWQQKAVDFRAIHR